MSTETPYDVINKIVCQMREESVKYGNSKISRLFYQAAERIEVELRKLEIIMGSHDQYNQELDKKLADIRGRRIYRILRKLRLMPK